MTYLRSVGLAPLAAAAVAGYALGRTWTDKTGQQQAEGEMVGQAGDKVWIQQEADLLLVPISEFCPADQQYIRQHSARRPAAPPPASHGEVRPLVYAPGRELCTLASPAVCESSGLACSRRTPGVFWTHNDSGDEARLYAFDRQGRDLGSLALRGVRAYDWEDLASLVIDGKGYLLVGDTGNNGRNAAVHMLYLVEEPAVDPERGVQVREMPVSQLIHFSYEDDYRNCEALGVDPTGKTILLVSKERRMECCVYALPWPENKPDKAFVARRIATLHVPTVTAMDVSPDGRHAVVLTYGDAYQFTRAAGEDWGAAFSRPAVLVEVPPRQQGESICYGPDGRTLYLTSENRPTPLLEIPVRKP